MRLAAAIIRPNAKSAVVSLRTSGVLPTTIPLLVASAMSMLSTGRAGKAAHRSRTAAIAIGNRRRGDISGWRRGINRSRRRGVVIGGRRVDRGGVDRHRGNHKRAVPAPIVAVVPAIVPAVAIMPAIGKGRGCSERGRDRECDRGGDGAGFPRAKRKAGHRGPPLGSRNMPYTPRNTVGNAR